jgi:hypothetical protein
MKPILVVLGLALIAIAAVYFLVPADQLPNFVPGHEAGLMRPRMKHGLMAAGAAGDRLVYRPALTLFERCVSAATRRANSARISAKLVGFSGLDAFGRNRAWTCEPTWTEAPRMFGRMTSGSRMILSFALWVASP